MTGRLRKWLTAATAAVMALGVATTAGAQENESTWERIQRTGEVRFAVFNNPPYFLQNKDTREWEGSLVEMARDVANELKVDIEFVQVGGWGELVLALQSDMIDFAAGMQATPQRATAIDFAGPLYFIEWVAVNNANFEGGENWSDYDNPDVTIAVITGSSDQLLLSQNAPNATQLQFKDLAGVTLAVTSGRADAMVGTVLGSMVMKEKNPTLGTFNSPKPRTALPGYFGIRSETDPRWRNFLNWWAEWNNKLGHNERRMRESMATIGITEIPDSVSFRE